ncbi:hypothetical protein EP7_001924 [Isosphaeraceae bacterium EP7]
MVGRAPDDDGDRPPAVAARIDELCDRFESDWQAGRRPRIEEYLEAESSPWRPESLRQLLAVELAYRRRGCDRPTQAEYRGRFPGHETEIEAIFGGASPNPDRGHDSPPPFPGRTGEADRNLLFDILALQMDFIARDSLIAAMHSWALAKHLSLAEILVEQGALSSARRALLDPLVQEHLAQHGGDPQRSLASLGSVGPIRSELDRIGDTDVHASLAGLGRSRPGDGDLDATRSYAVGVPTSAGTRFRILRPYAKGGIGQVPVALDEELHREVALKEIQDRLAHDPDSRVRFEVEAEITGGLEHPGIVPVYGLGRYDDGRPFYAMRFIRGDSLRDAISPRAPTATPVSGPSPSEHCWAGSWTSVMRSLARTAGGFCTAT